MTGRVSWLVGHLRRGLALLRCCPHLLLDLLRRRFVVVEQDITRALELATGPGEDGDEALIGDLAHVRNDDSERSGVTQDEAQPLRQPAAPAPALKGGADAPGR